MKGHRGLDPRSVLRTTGALLLLAGVLAACGDTDADAPPGGEVDGGTDTGGRGYGLDGLGSDATDGADTGDDSGSGADSPGTGPLALVETDLGQILADAGGMTLYIFTNDSAGTSTCEDSCLDLWPPVPGDVTAGPGLEADLLGTLERSDGTTQASYADRPLYYFAQDAEPGDTTGQGFNDVWFVVGADGEPVAAR
ncbi:COG4315 family predicted lipoprotein [Georgenia subflava]|uniref:Lipoprotein n=1 Tax=Georgenia subflava TaxID=1622177 RepID=A0A6N7EJ27_9MICO|nr:hypothetical protein [Georgenia subflava]MPV38080.1 hypothetical protein [Georgenia subflava]